MSQKSPAGVVGNGQTSSETFLLHDECGASVEERTGQLQRSNEALRILLIRLLALHEQERQRLSRDLGESVAQILACVGMNLSVVQGAAESLKPAALRALADSAELVEKCATEILALSYELHPPLLDELGLVAALRWYAETFSRRSGIVVDVHAPYALGRLTPEVKTALFRIVQESLLNVHRHNRFGAVRVQLTRSPDAVTLCIEDFTALAPAVGGRTPKPVAEAERSLHTVVGIMSMRERVRALGGQFAIDAGDTGTVVRTSVPLDGNAPDDFTAAAS